MLESNSFMKINIMDLHKTFPKDFDFGSYQCSNEHDGQIEIRQFTKTRLVVNEVTYIRTYRL